MTYKLSDKLSCYSLPLLDKKMRSVVRDFFAIQEYKNTKLHPENVKMSLI